MITTINIKNIGIIDNLSIDLNQEFNVLTGETGAGKTLIIDSLAIICGGRFSKEMIRRGETHSYIEACIYMPENEMATEGNIIVSREIYNTGRNLCKINGRLVTVSELKEFMQKVIDIHGQNDNQTILEKSSHIAYLDSFIGNNMLKVKQEYRKLFEEYQSIKEKLKNNYGDEKEKQRRLDLLKYQQKEIEIANLKIGEEVSLEEQRKIMLNSEKIAENLKLADDALSEQAIDAINVSIRALEKIENIDCNYNEKLLQLKNVYYDIQEIARDISSMKGNVYFNDEEQNEVEERLNTIYSLKRKYGNSIEEIKKYEEELEKQIEEIQNVDEINQKLKQEEKKIEEKMSVLAIQMNKIRTTCKAELEKKIDAELQDLEMKNARFKVQIVENKEKQYNKNGLDEIEFLIITNVGEEAKPLIKIASGGEMSRIMLAIKTILAEVDKVPVLIFDEIDTGISGIAAKAVGEKLKYIAKHHQVLCVTHQASIAAKGNYHYYISKQVENETTKTRIELLTEEQTIREIARIASGEVTKIALQHARELKRVS